jgi:hypothetical protein
MARAHVPFAGVRGAIAQAVGTPVSQFGGFECPRFSYGHRLRQPWHRSNQSPPVLFIPKSDGASITPAHARIEEFIADNVAERVAVVAGLQPIDWSGLPALHE